MNLLQIIEEQSLFGFTGRINVLQKDNSRLLGEIFQVDGRIVYSRYGAIYGKRTLFAIILEQTVNPLKFKYIVEPEQISSEQQMFSISFEELSQEVSRIRSDVAMVQKEKPPLNIKLMINDNFIISGDDISPMEFDVLCTISDYSRVFDIYKNSTLYEFDCTRALISLRKKKAIKVI